MRYELRDYQRDAAREVLRRIAQTRRDWVEDRERSSFALSAITGSGKTVIATAVIEALFFGSSDLDTDADPRVAFLWITDDPALNRQTRARMHDASELLTPWSLPEVDEAFLDTNLAPGRVYFLNTRSSHGPAGSPRAARMPARFRSGTSSGTRSRVARPTLS